MTFDICKLFGIRKPVSSSLQSTLLDGPQGEQVCGKFHSECLINSKL